jgi:hypothetical protein
MKQIPIILLAAYVIDAVAAGDQSPVVLELMQDWIMAEERVAEKVNELVTELGTNSWKEIANRLAIDKRNKLAAELGPNGLEEVGRRKRLSAEWCKECWLVYYTDTATDAGFLMGPWAPEEDNALICAVSKGKSLLEIWGDLFAGRRSYLATKQRVFVLRNEGILPRGRLPRYRIPKVTRAPKSSRASVSVVRFFPIMPSLPLLVWHPRCTSLDVGVAS